METALAISRWMRLARGAKSLLSFLEGLEPAREGEKGLQRMHYKNVLCATKMVGGEHDLWLFQRPL